MQNISDLILKRDAIESRIAQLSEYLNKPEIKGFREVDDEGYPHPDAELIISLRKMKHEYNCLQNDYNDIMETITNELYKIHGESLQYQQSTPSISTSNLWQLLKLLTRIHQQINVDFKKVILSQVTKVM
ncbi:26S proteasome non-ATPase regulatory subunit [Entamoeba marina]